jgi:hypothetical protein
MSGDEKLVPARGISWRDPENGEIQMDVGLELALARGNGAAWARLLRSHYLVQRCDWGPDPHIALLAEMLDPNGDSKLKLEFGYRGRKNPKHGLWKDLERAMRALFEQKVREELIADGRPAMAKTVESKAAEEFGVCDRTIRNRRPKRKGKVIVD